jgi:PadR family transcriptional regulator, regulatory protein PadR
MSLIDVRVALLQALVPGDAYGLELIERVAEATQGRALLLQGRVYPALRELEREGLAESYSGEPLPERGGRPRRYYRLTAAGQRVALDDARALAGLLRPALGVA